MSNVDDAGLLKKLIIRPPSENLSFEHGMWRPSTVAKVSYPEVGNDACFAVEDRSYWFRHRNDVIVAAIKRFPPSGPIYDIGGGNGFVSLAMEAAGHSVVLVEPGSGAANALRRGVTNVVHGSLEDAAFSPSSIAAVAVFDVVEHVEHEDRFFKNIHQLLAPSGKMHIVRWGIAEDAAHTPAQPSEALAHVGGVGVQKDRRSRATLSTGSPPAARPCGRSPAARNRCGRPDSLASLPLGTPLLSSGAGSSPRARSCGLRPRLRGGGRPLRRAPDLPAPVLVERDEYSPPLANLNGRETGPHISR